MYIVEFDDEAISFLSKLQKDTAKRIYNKLISAKESPFHFFERLEGRTDYKLRSGDYRVIADINQGNQTIKITLIGHRKNVYEKI
jgi:mRNA interferase RelE/StbE